MVIRRDGRTDPFFDGAARDELMIKRCADCGHWHGPDASGCGECLGERLEWAAAAGTAELVTWAAVHGRGGGAPAPIALVELAEGPWLHTGLDGVADPREGLPLRAHFVHPAEGEPYLVFRAV